MYQPDKKKDAHLVLVLLGHRWLMVDIKAKTVYQVTPGDLHAQDKDYESGDLASPSALIPTSDWIEHDVGPAEDIHVTLGDYGRVLEVALPHLMDLRPFYLISGSACIRSKNRADGRRSRTFAEGNSRDGLRAFAVRRVRENLS